MPTTTNPSKKRKEDRKARQLLFGACLLLGVGFLLAMAGVGYVVYVNYVADSAEVVVVPDELSAAEQQLVNAIFSGEQQTARGHTELLSLHLLSERAFQLHTTFIGRSDRPTVRTGRWYQLDGQLHLEVIELDGEPLRQGNLAFAVYPESLVAEQYDRAWFDYEAFELVHSGEVVPDSAE